MGTPKHIRSIAIVLISIHLLIFSQPGLAQPAQDHFSYLPLITREHNPNWRWGEPIVFDPDPRPNHVPLMIIDHLGRVHLLWDIFTTPRFILHAIYNGSIWSPTTPLSGALGISSVLNPPIIDENGTIHLIWGNYLGTGVNEPYRLLYRNFDGANWSAEEELYRTASPWSLNAMPQFDPSGGLRATLVESALFSSTVYQAVQTGSEWDLSGPIIPNHSAAIAWPDMRGGIRFYGDDTTGTLYYSYWLNGQFQINGYQSTGIVRGRETQLDGQDNLHVFWDAQVPIPGDTVNGLYSQCLDHAFNWSSEQVLTGQSTLVNTAVSATDWNAHSVLAWEESDPPRFRVGYWEGCDQVAELSIPGMEPAAGQIEAVTLSSDLGKFCVLVREPSTATYKVQCADITG